MASFKSGLRCYFAFLGTRLRFDAHEHGMLICFQMMPFRIMVLIPSHVDRLASLVFFISVFGHFLELFGFCNKWESDCGGKCPGADIIALVTRTCSCFMPAAGVRGASFAKSEDDNSEEWAVRGKGPSLDTTVRQLEKC